jgi:hypothetical protein
VNEGVYVYIIEIKVMGNKLASFLQVGVSIKMSSFNLSRIVTLTPFCTVVNKSSFELEVGEIASDGSMPTNKWNYVASSEVKFPFNILDF